MATACWLNTSFLLGPQALTCRNFGSRAAERARGPVFGHEEGLIYYAKTPRIPSFIQRSDEEILGFCGDFGDRRFSGGFSVYFEE